MKKTHVLCLFVLSMKSRQLHQCISSMPTTYFTLYQLLYIYDEVRFDRVARAYKLRMHLYAGFYGMGSAY